MTSLFEALPPKNGRCLVIAEAGVNHNGDMGRAKEMVWAAKDAGADAVKFQTFQAKRLATAGAAQARYQTRNSGREESQAEMLHRLELSRQDHDILTEACQEAGISFLSTPFDDGSLDLLAELGVPALKLSSGDLTNLPFIRRAAKLGKPLILSTGMANWEEVVEGVSAAQGADLTLLQCVSDYPARPADVNLRVMARYQEAFGCRVGYSDHCLGNAVCLAAVALGAEVVEKHFTLDRELPGPDHRASATPVEISELVKGIDEVIAALGDGIKRPTARESDARLVARKSLMLVLPMPSGSVLRPEDLVAKRPGTGIPPSRLAKVVGRRLARDVEADSPLAWEDLE
ncbi:MAG: N-acetylneuraminate synthase [Fimbriimonadaceae bacterium]|nr:N-acetylneuraminate synthase [Fimbriimonadaceae bacterium]QYK59262.1 MAG: N-acetylneuraminate synthase [Fimbriimonadaceae bacterium]